MLLWSDLLESAVARPEFPSQSVHKRVGRVEKRSKQSEATRVCVCVCACVVQRNLCRTIKILVLCFDIHIAERGQGMEYCRYDKITDNAKHMAWSDLMQQMLPFFFSAPLPPTSVSHVRHPTTLAAWHSTCCSRANLLVRSACSRPSRGTRGTPLPIGQPEVRGGRPHGLIRLTETRKRTWHHVSLSRDSVLFFSSSLSVITPGPWPVPFWWDRQEVRAAPAHSQLAIIGRGLVMCPVKMRGLEAPEGQLALAYQTKRTSERAGLSRIKESP